MQLNRQGLNRNLTAFLALLGLVIGSSIGYFVDYASGLSPDPELLAAVQSCWYCPSAAFPFLFEVVYLNLGQLAGAILGLGAGVLGSFAWQALNRERAAEAEAARRRELEALADETLRRRVQQLTALAGASRALAQTSDLSRILGRALEEAVRVTGADCGTALLLDLQNAVERPVALRLGDPLAPGRILKIESVVTATGQSRVVRDLEAEGETPMHEGVRSALLVPLTRDETVIGLLHLHSKQPDAFDAESLEFVQALAANTAQAAANAQRYHEELRRAELFRRRSDQLQQLFQTTSAVRADRPLAANLQAIALGVQKACGFGTVIVGLLDPESNLLQRVVAVGLPADAAGQSEHAAEPWERLSPFLREEFRLGRAYFIPYDQAADLYQSLETRPPEGSPPAAAEPGQWRPADILLVPIHASTGEDVLGLLSLDEPGDGRRPVRQTIEVLESFASQAALAIENARLYQSARQSAAEARQQAGVWRERADQLIGLAEAESIVTSALRVSDVVSLALDQARNVVAYDGAMLWLRDDPEASLRPIAVRGGDEIERRKLAEDLAESALLAEMTVTRNSIQVGDVRRDGRFPPSAAGILQSWLGVPLVSKGEVVGLLAVDKKEVNYYRPGHVELLQAFANHAGAALENARLYEGSVQGALELNERSQRLALLSRVGGELSGTLEVERVLEIGARELAGALGVGRAQALVVDEGRGAQGMVSGAYPAGSAGGSGGPAALEAVQEAQGLVVVEAGERGEALGWLGAGVTSGLLLPLMVGESVIGVVGLGETRGGRRWSRSEVELGMALAGQVGVAAANARLYEKTQRRLTEVAAVGQFGRAVSSTIDLKQLYETVRVQVGALVGAETMYLAVYDGGRDEVKYEVVVEGGEVKEGGVSAPGGLVGHILQTQRAVLLSGEVGARLEELGIPASLALEGPAGEGGRLKSYLGVPLLVGERAVGVLAVADLERPDAFTEAHARMLAAVAPQLAAAIENAQLYEEAQQAAATAHGRASESHERASQLEELTEAAGAVASALQVNDVVWRVFDQLGRVVPNDGAMLWFRESPDGHWRVAGVRGGDEVERRKLAEELAESALLAEIAVKRAPVLAANARREKRLPEGLSSQARSWLGAPLVSKGEVVGLLAVDKKEVNYYRPGHVELLQAFANHAGAALENARLYEGSVQGALELNERSQRLALLSRVGGELSGTLEVERVLEIGARELAGALGVGRAQALVVDEGRGVQGVVSGAYPAGSAGGSGGLAALEAVQEAQGLVVVEEGERAEALGWLGAGVTSGLLLPLMVGESVIGVVGLGETRGGRRWSRSEVELGMALAGQVGVAAANARLYEKTQRRLTEVAAVGQFGRAVSSTIDLKQLYETVRVQVGALVGAETMYLAVYDGGRDEVKYEVVVEGGEVKEGGVSAPGGLVGHILQTQRAVLLSGEVGARLEEMGIPASLALEGPAGEGGRLKSYLGVPLLVGERAVGVLAVADLERPDAFTDDHARVLSIIAAQLAGALENVRRYEETRRTIQGLDRQSQDLARNLAAERERYEQAQQAAQELQRQVSQRSEELALERERYEHTRSLADDLERQVEEQTAGLAAERERYEEARQQAADLERQIAEQSAALAAERERYEQAEQQAQELERRVNERDEAMAQRQEQLEQARQAIRDLEVQVQSRAASLAEERLRFELAQQTIQSLQARLGERADGLEADRSRFDQTLQAATELQQSTESQAEELARVQVQYAEALQLIQALENQMQKQTNQAGQLAAELEQERARSQQAQQAIQRLEAQLAEGSTHLAEEQGSRQQAQQAIERLEALAAERAALLSQEQAGHQQTQQTVHELEAELQSRAEELRRAQARLDSLLAIVGELSAIPEADRLLARALALLREALGAEYAAAYLLDPKSRRLMQQAVAGALPPGAKADDFAALRGDEGLPGWVIQRREAAAVTDLTADRRWSRGRLSKTFRSAVAAPLVAENRAMGVLLFLSPRTGIFNPVHGRLAGAVAGQAAVALCNDDLQRRLQERLQVAAAGEPLPAGPARPAAALAGGEAQALPAPRLSPARWMGATMVALGLLVVTAFVIALAFGPQVTALAAAFRLGGEATIAPTQAASAEVVQASATGQGGLAAPGESPSPAATQPAVEPTASLTASPTITLTPTTTETPTLTPSPTITPTPSATLPGGVTALAVVNLPEGQAAAARVRDAPNGTVIAGVVDGTQVEVLQGREVADDIAWVEIRTPDGDTGWIAEELLEIITP